MSTAAEVLQTALSLSPQERAGIAQELLQSLPAGPIVYEKEEQLAAELNRRLKRIEDGQETFFTGEETIRRAREALARSKAS
jgi:putative addiction module component (TIGR02574 family)